ncbi:MAG TPA: T9SS type A sorting domain-containing protein [Bacteroidia bacterium]|nr:T9SS type A sorting domain-containing protein [Bacteroidia bacterium]HRS58911.1 T9SS type A sorting domain-containing protein [Bacteroidia bacterium]HRU67407.1 T9SS type A sorting domain-containing protein [Bacteroidia bacterium]
MKKICFVITLLLTALNSYTQISPVNWQTLISSDCENVSVDISFIQNGIIFLAGNFISENVAIGDFILKNNSPADAPFKNDFFIASINEKGKIINVFKYPGERFGTIKDMIVTDYFIYAIAFLYDSKGNYGFFLLKFNMKGELLNEVYFDTYLKDFTFHLSCLTVDSDENIYVSGISKSDSINIGHFKNQISKEQKYYSFIIKFSPNLSLKWVKAINFFEVYPFYEEIRDIKVDESQNLYFLKTRSLIILDKDGNHIKNIEFGALYGSFVNVTPLNSGEFYLIGNFCSPDYEYKNIKLIKERPGQNAVFLIKFSTGFHPVWGKLIEGDQYLGIDIANNYTINRATCIVKDRLFIHLSLMGTYILSNHKKISINNINNPITNVLVVLDNNANIGNIFPVFPGNIFTGMTDEKNYVAVYKEFQDHYHFDSLNPYFSMKGWVVRKRALVTFSQMNEDQKIKEFSVYPNPSLNGKFTITSSSSIQGKNYVYDLNGNLILETESTSIDLSNFPKASYLLKSEQFPNAVWLLSQ